MEKNALIKLILFIIIYTIMVFIWSFVYLNRTAENRETNNAFLSFISVILFWMFFDISQVSSSNIKLDIFIKSLYFVSMLNISVFFLSFIYRFLKRNYDTIFYIVATVNTVTIIARYMFPINYSAENFWQLTNPVIAPIMATCFSLPVILSLYLIIKYFKNTKDTKQKKQLVYIMIGVSTGTIISVISEYIVPSVVGAGHEISLMYLAILDLVLFLYFAIIRNKFLNVKSEYIYNKLFTNSNQGLILVSSNLNILSINNVAKSILYRQEVSGLERTDEYINEYIREYDFDENYNQYGTTVEKDNKVKYLIISQSPIEIAEEKDVKLLQIADNTEKELLNKIEANTLKENSYIDGLTGLYNKRFLTENYFDSDVKVAYNLSIIFLDIDNFKLVNDVFGHLVGDKVLQAVSECIRTSIRNEEKAVRYGGDEFLILLGNTTAENAYIVAERIRNNVGNNNMLKNGSIEKITLSIGISEGNGNVYELLEKADKAMYISKDNGRNQTTIYQES